VLAKKLTCVGIAFLPDAFGVVTERDTGRILSSARHRPHDRQPHGPRVQRLSDVAHGGDGGLLGITVSPKYKTDKSVYVYYSTDKDNGSPGSRSRQAAADLHRHPARHGEQRRRPGVRPGRLSVRRTGDVTAAGTQAQSAKSLGARSCGSPRLASRRRETRKVPRSSRPVPQRAGLAWDPSGRMYASESNQKTYGELNLIRPGRNYGFPRAEAPAPRQAHQPRGELADRRLVVLRGGR